MLCRMPFPQLAIIALTSESRPLTDELTFLPLPVVS